MNNTKLLILCVLFPVIFACEDLPCRTDMSNPTLGIGFLDKDSTGLTEKGVKVKIGSVHVYDLVLTNDGFVSNIRLPILPDNDLCELSFFYDSLMRFKDTIRIDTIVERIDTLAYDSLCWNDEIIGKDSCIFDDTIQIGFPIHVIDTVETVDTFYIRDFTQTYRFNYNAELFPVSPECGVNYEYRIDTNSLEIQGDYIDSVIIINSLIKTPQNESEEIGNHIQIYF